jgi:hypothetical protein
VARVGWLAVGVGDPASTLVHGLATHVHRSPDGRWETGVRGSSRLGLQSEASIEIVSIQRTTQPGRREIDGEIEIDREPAGHARVKTARPVRGQFRPR